ncbi:MAG: amylosucrase, partial [Chloroflexota bacterium]
MQDFNIAVEAEKTLYRILPRVEARFADYRKANLTDWTTFKKRLEFHFERLFGILLRLYGSQYDFFFHLEELIILLAQSWIERGSDLKLLDEKREKDTDWYQSNQMLGGVCYVDLFAGNLKGVEQKIPYFQELGLSYLHLM